MLYMYVRNKIRFKFWKQIFQNCSVILAIH